MIDYDRLAQSTLAHLEGVVRHFVDPDARRSGRELWFVDATGASSSNRTSASINIASGKWHLRGNSTCRATSGHDVISLVAAMQGVEMHIAAEMVADYLGVEVPRRTSIRRTPSPEPSKPGQSSNDADAIRRAIELWSASEPWRGTLGEAYLRSRFIDPAVIGDDELRFMQYCPLGEYATYPAALFPIVDVVAGLQTGVQRIFIWSDGSGLRDQQGRAVKKMMGRKQQSGIWFGPGRPDQVFMVEGPEDAMSVRTMRPTATVVSTIDATHMGNQALPNSVRQVIVIPDAGDAGEQGLKRAVEAYAHLDVRVARLPLDMDANDLLRGGAPHGGQRP